jgi:hypothetical protein
MGLVVFSDIMRRSGMVKIIMVLVEIIDGSKPYPISGAEALFAVRVLKIRYGLPIAQPAYRLGVGHDKKSEPGSLLGIRM